MNYILPLLISHAQIFFILKIIELTVIKSKIYEVGTYTKAVIGIFKREKNPKFGRSGIFLSTILGKQTGPTSDIHFSK